MLETFIYAKTSEAKIQTNKLLIKILRLIFRIIGTLQTDKIRCKNQGYCYVYIAKTKDYKREKSFCFPVYKKNLRYFCMTNRQLSLYMGADKKYFSNAYKKS